MCGICGYTHNGDPLGANLIERMKSALFHRGPDQDGAYLDDHVAIGHTRLCIIDIEQGRQPMADDALGCRVSFNGEIYNYRELKKELEDQGYRFHTNSDTEVLLKAYHCWHEKMLPRLDGMFAFALWDTKRRSLMLARDPFGKKPLYYALRDRQLIFASELKALTVHPHVSKTIHKPALSQYLLYEYVPSPNTIYQDVYKLDAGHYMVWRAGRVRNERYWELPLSRKPAFDGDFDAAVQSVRSLLDLAVRKRLMSDVPLGVFLSGGIDSSVIVASMTKYMDPADIQTFTIGFEEDSYDETTFARLTAKRFGTRHHEQIMDSRQAQEALFGVVQQFDEPFADASALPTYLLSQFARQRITVALGGDGGDEMLAGYDTFPAMRLAGWVDLIPPRVLESVFLPALQSLPPSDRNMNLLFRLSRFVKYPRTHPILRNQLWMSAFDPAGLAKILNPEFAATEDPLGPLLPIITQCSRASSLAGLQYAFIKTYLQEGILTKVDRASMAHSLEVRSPFLDKELAGFLTSIPDRWKMNVLQTKYILRKAFQGILPASILYRKKKGFGIPKARWLREQFRPLVSSALDSHKIRQAGIFRDDHVQQMVSLHLNRKRDFQKEIWTLLMFELWRQCHCPG